MTIKHKILAVPDWVCKGCNQFWDGACRAYQVPHSDEEQQHRLPAQAPPCRTYLRQRRERR